MVRECGAIDIFFASVVFVVFLSLCLYQLGIMVYKNYFLGKKKPLNKKKRK